MPHAGRGAIGHREDLRASAARVDDADRIDGTETECDRIAAIPPGDPPALWLVSNEEPPRQRRDRGDPARRGIDREEPRAAGVEDLADAAIAEQQPMTFELEPRQAEIHGPVRTEGPDGRSPAGRAREHEEDRAERIGDR